MLKSKGWKRGAVKKGIQRVSRVVSIEGKYDFDLCSTDNDIFCDVTEELASLKTENSYIYSAGLIKNRKQRHSARFY